MKQYTRSISLLTVLLVSVWQILSAQTTNRAAAILQHLKNPSKDYIVVVSHRGDWRYAPENSLMAIKHCIDLGVDVIELDFRLTKDGHLVAMHDATVDRTTNGKGKVSELTLEEIKKFRLKNGCGVQYSSQQVPTLEEIMLLVKDKTMVNLDKTESRWVREAYEVLKKTGTVNQAIFKGNDDIKTMRDRYGDIMDHIIYMPKLWYNMPSPRTFRKEYENDINPFYYEILFDTEKAETFEIATKDVKKDGDGFLAIALWDELCAGRTDEKTLLEGPDKAWGWLIDQGANAIMTDRTQELLDYLEKRKLRKTSYL